jgi:hypothetical protein
MAHSELSPLQRLFGRATAAIFKPILNDFDGDGLMQINA